MNHWSAISLPSSLVTTSLYILSLSIISSDRSLPLIVQSSFESLSKKKVEIHGAVVVDILTSILVPTSQFASLVHFDTVWDSRFGFREVYSFPASVDAIKKGPFLSDWFEVASGLEIRGFAVTVTWSNLEMRIRRYIAWGSRTLLLRDLLECILLVVHFVDREKWMGR